MQHRFRDVNEAITRHEAKAEARESETEAVAENFFEAEARLRGRGGEAELNS